MAATIDHLRADHHVRVIQSFTDARGIAYGVGDAGIIRAMGLDTKQMEIWLEWELGGRTERLHFAMQATSGPGNGRMREYFELGAEVVDQQHAPSAASRRDDERKTATVPMTSPHPSAGTNLGEVAVACDCDPALHRPVLALGTGVSACMRCGVVTVTHTIGDDGRHTGSDWVNYVVDDVNPLMLEWLAQWPRVTVRRHDLDGWPRPAGLHRNETVYLPANTRCATATELLAVERAADVGVRAGLFPMNPPPGPLSPKQLAFAQFAAAAQLTPHSDLSDLLASADPQNAACAVAVWLLQQRPDVFDVMIGALRSDDPKWQGAGAAMAFSIKPYDPRLPDLLVELVTTLPVVAHSSTLGRVAYAVRFLEIMAVIAEHVMNTAAIRAALSQLQRRVVSLDADLAGHIGYVLRVLHGIPTQRTGFRF